MSRVIKFRAWNKEESRMIDLNGFEIAFKGLQKEGEVTYAIEQGNLYMYDADDVEIMQFTGLTDKNGVEIYEGDILALVFHDEFHNDSVSIEDGEHYCNVNVHWDGDGYWMFSENNSAWYFPQSLNECATYAVIGNIHQNPELIGK